MRHGHRSRPTPWLIDAHVVRSRFERAAKVRPRKWATLSQHRQTLVDLPQTLNNFGQHWPRFGPNRSIWVNSGPSLRSWSNPSASPGPAMVAKTQLLRSRDLFEPGVRTYLCVFWLRRGFGFQNRPLRGPRRPRPSTLRPDRRRRLGPSASVCIAARAAVQQFSLICSPVGAHAR